MSTKSALFVINFLLQHPALCTCWIDCKQAYTYLKDRLWLRGCGQYATVKLFEIDTIHFEVIL